MGIKFPVILQLSDKGDNVSTGVALSEQNYSLSSRVHRLLDGTIHGQAAWIHALGGVERNEHPAGTCPSIGSSNKRPQLPSWGRFF